MYVLKPIPKESIPRALARAQRYRLLNEPREAQSICLDVLAVDPGNQDALVSLVLAITDLFRDGEATTHDALAWVGQLATEFDRRYYAGVVEERWAKAALFGGESRRSALGFLKIALQHFEAAQDLAPEHNHDAVLRWNACVRMIHRHQLLAYEETAPAGVESLDDDVPMR